MSLFNQLQDLEAQHGIRRIILELAEIAKDHEGNLVDENPAVSREWHVVTDELLAVARHLKAFLADTTDSKEVARKNLTGGKP